MRQLACVAAAISCMCLNGLMGALSELIVGCGRLKNLVTHCTDMRMSEESSFVVNMPSPCCALTWSSCWIWCAGESVTVIVDAFLVLIIEWALNTSQSGGIEFQEIRTLYQSLCHLHKGITAELVCFNRSIEARVCVQGRHVTRYTHKKNHPTPNDWFPEKSTWLGCVSFDEPWELECTAT